MSNERDRENFETCKRIALELEQVADGELYKDPETGEALEAKEDENGRTYVEAENGTRYYEDPEDEEEDLDDLEQFSVYDYLDDIYDVEYTLYGDLTYKAVRLMIACGGPNIYVNTKSGDVELFWWTETARYPLSRDVINEIDAMYEEFYQCR